MIPIHNFRTIAMTTTEQSRVPEDLGDFLDSDNSTRRNALADIHSGTPVSELPPSISQHLINGVYVLCMCDIMSI